MQEIRLWAIEEAEEGEWVATSVETLQSTETEAKLEDLLVRSPGLLMDNLVLIGRQVPTEGGPLDLLGVDEDGRLVVFELKRGTLTREAVAQVVDYASDIAEMDTDRLGKIVQGASGHGGIEKVEDFYDWYSQNYPNSESALAGKPKMVLVGLGVDDRARRMVNFLVDSGVDIQLLTFHGFEREGKLFVARQVESVSPGLVPPGGAETYTKEANLRTLRKEAASLGVGPFLEEVAGFLNDHLPAYQWPGTTSFSFSLTERTDRGRPTQRVYISLRLNYKDPGSLNIVFFERAVEAAGPKLRSLPEELGKEAWYDKFKGLQVQVRPQSWPSIKADLEPALSDLVAGWKAKDREVGEPTPQGENS